MIKALYKRIVPLSSRMVIRTKLKQLYGNIFLQGYQYGCNICHRTFKKFYSKGNGLVVRDNAECPYCGSLERTRLLKFYLDKETNIKEDGVKVLHIAPQWGIKSWIKSFKKHPYYINGDLLPENADEVIDITEIPYKEGSFDIEICSHVLGHVPNQKLALEELFRCLKPDGMAIILTILNEQSDKTIEGEPSMTSEERLNTFGEFDLVRLHGKSDLVKQCQEVGFQVEVIDYRKHFTENERKFYALGNGERELIFKLTKDV